MKEFLYYIVGQISRIHSKILQMNDAFEYDFSDKQLHFLVIGVLGMALVFLIHPLFNQLAKRDHVMVITWIYVFTLILVITFAIEIGQKITNTGVMEFDDIVFGVFGFLILFVIFGCIRFIVKTIYKMIKKKGRRSER